PSNQSAFDGSSTSFDLGSFSDPGANDAPWHVDINWGDNSAHTTFNTNSQGGLGSRNHTYADGPHTYTVTVTVTDKDTGSSSASFTSMVINVPPTVTGAADQTANEGASTSFTLGSFSDPGADSPWSVDVNWGDGSSHTTFNKTSTGSLGSQSHTYADNGSYTVTVTVTDKDGGSGSATFTINVSNVAPTVTAAANQTANEGASTSFTLGSFSDPGANDSPWAADVTWGDGSAHTTFNQNTRGSLGSQSHTYADNNGTGTYTVTVKVTDKDGGFGQATFTATVANVAPTITNFSGSGGSLVGLTGPLTFVPTTFSGTFTDPGLVDNPWMAAWSWDGTPDLTATQSYGANG